MAGVDALARVLTRGEPRWELPAAARELAGAGVPVFPCVPGAKRPLTEHGFHDATAHPGRVSAWWRQHPGANIGVPTGAASGVVVVDIDVHGPVAGFDAFDRAHRAGLVSGWQLLVTTPSGGMHAYFPTTPGEIQRSWQAASAGIDFRGDGGYIVVPPSEVVVENEAVGYRVHRVTTSAGTTVDSERLREFLDPRPRTRQAADFGPRREVDASRLAAWVAARGEGERNRGLFWAACRLAENDVPASDALDVLGAAASDAGLGEREIVATVRSAYRTTRPRDSSPSQVQGSSPAAPGGGIVAAAAARSPSRTRGL